MLWEQSPIVLRFVFLTFPDVQVIVMITNLVERNRIKADTYWPTRIGQTLRFGQLRVKLVREYQRGHNVMIRTMHFWEAEEVPEKSGGSGGNDEKLNGGDGFGFDDGNAHHFE